MADKPKIKLTVNSEALKKRFGGTVEIEVDKNGTPIDRFWRNRLRDAKLDKCVSKVETKKVSVKSKANEGEK